MKIKKIASTDVNLNVRGQACGDDCTETKIWVGRTDGNTSGCVIYNTVYTPKTRACLKNKKYTKHLFKPPFSW